jgi:hypothetical protein
VRAPALSGNDIRAQLIPAILVGLTAFLLYRSTLLPGLDFGDTAAFQDAGGSIEASPRQGYPLYFALGNLVVWTVGGEPAFGMNLASALTGSAACGLFVLLAGMVTRSVSAGIFGGLLLAGSYTFWSQSLIAEVYALHVLLVTATLAALLWWSRHPASTRGLAVVFAVYALGFGNHLMMVLLAPTLVIAIVLLAPDGARALLRPRVIALAALMAALGSLQYVWNFLFLWTQPYPPASFVEGLQIFWFDVTKSDWRESLVLGVSETALKRRLPMYAFDLRQQIGIVGIALALLGTIGLAYRSWRLATAFFAGYATALLFAVTYNVGDVHVFLLPSHLFVILASACGAGIVIELARRIGRRGAVASTVVTAMLIAFPAWRMFDTYPAVDRSADRRPEQRLEQFVAGLSAEHTLLIADLNWQLQNGLDYYLRHRRADLNMLRAGNRLLTLPLLIDENRTHGREIVLAPSSRALVEAAYGELYTIDPDRRVPSVPLSSRLERLPEGSRYVLGVLRAYTDVPLDAADLRRAYGMLLGSKAVPPPDDVYTVVAGRVGRPAELVHHASRPFRVHADLWDLRLDARMESWLPMDTMRRAGFGHVIVNRQHVLTLERGVSFVALGADGRPLWTTYASSVYAPQLRYRIAPLARQGEP